MPGRREPIDRLVDLVIAVPVSTAVAARRSMPIVGRLFRRSVAPGAEIVDAVVAGDRVASPPVGDDSTVADIGDEPRGGVPAPVDRSASAERPDVTALPIDGYDHLAARQVVDLLDALTGPELEAVEAYERAHRHRQTVLRKIEQLVT